MYDDPVLAEFVRSSSISFKDSPVVKDFVLELLETVKGSDRVSAIVGGAMVENVLGKALRLQLKGDDEALKWLFQFEAPLGSFKAKIAMSHVLGVIGVQTYKNLGYIKEVRNKFAHNIFMPDNQHPSRPVTFKTQQVKNWCDNLKMPHNKAPSFSSRPPRDKFIMACMVIAVHLAAYVDKPQSFTKPILP